MKKFSKKHFPAKNRKIREKPKIKFDTTQIQRKHGKGWRNKFRYLKKEKENQRK